MIKVIVHQRRDQDCWYIKEVSDIGETNGKICYKTRAEAAAVAHRNHPYVDIYIQD